MYTIELFSAVKETKAMSFAKKIDLTVDNRIKQFKAVSERRFCVFSYLWFLDFI